MLTIALSVALSGLVLMVLAGVLGVTLTLGKNVSGPMNAGESVQIDAETVILANPACPKAWGGTLTTRTDNDTGVVTFADPAHAVANGMRVDVYWDAGSRKGMTTSGLAGAAITIDVGSGDNLPAATTPVTIAPAVSVPFPVVGDNVQALVLAAPAGNKAQVVLDISGTDTFNVSLKAGTLYDWTAFSTNANPLAGLTITTAWLSSDDTTTTNGSVQALAMVTG